MREFGALYGIKKSRTTPYHPEGNAQAERFNRTLFGLIKSFSESERRRWPDFLPHEVFVYNLTPHCTTGVAPFTLLFGREPLIPLDQILGRTDANWDQNFVREQSELLERAGVLVKERMEQRARRNEKGHNFKAKSAPLAVGLQVLLRKCAFKGRHKLEDVYGRESYTVVWRNEQSDVYRIRPVNGGSERTVNRKYLRMDPLAVTESGEESDSSDSSDWDPIITKPNSSDSGVVDQGVDAEIVGEPPTDFEDAVIPCRRSQRTTKGTHRNPHRLPRSVLQ